MSTLRIPLAEKRSGRTKLIRACAMTSSAVVLTIALTLMATLAPVVAQEKMATPAPAATQETKPNILFIMGDDIGWMQPSIYLPAKEPSQSPVGAVA